VRYEGVERVHPVPEGLRLAVLMEGLGSGLQVCVFVYHRRKEINPIK